MGWERGSPGLGVRLVLLNPKGRSSPSLSPGHPPPAPQKASLWGPCWGQSRLGGSAAGWCCWRAERAAAPGGEVSGTRLVPGSRYSCGR